MDRKPPMGGTDPAMIAAGSRGPQLDRRDFCVGLGAAAGLMAFNPAPVRAAAKQELDLDKKADLLRALIKLRGSLDSELVIGWLRAKRFAFSEGRVEPLCGLLSATFKKFRQVSEQRFEAVVLEITHYTDIETGKLLERLVMPFSNREVSVPAYRHGPATTRFEVHLEEKTGYEPAANSNQGEFAPAGTVLMSKSVPAHYVRNDELFLRHEEYGRVYPNNAVVPTTFYQESTIWMGPLHEVLDEGIKNVDARVAYSSMTSWRPWMQMGKIPGHTSSNGFGGKARSVEHLPEDFLRYTALRHPDVLKDPEAVLDSLTK